MSYETYRKVERYVHQLFAKGEKDASIKHLERTVFWLLQLKPDADEALQIAALTHDIERASRDPQVEKMIEESPQGFLDEDYLRKHSERGAALIEKYLALQGVSPEMITKVRHLVAGHEFTGTDEQNVLKDADSISYFENTIEEFLFLRTVSYGKEKVRAKFDWMFNRITSKKAKKITAAWYEQAIVQLKNK